MEGDVAGNTGSAAMAEVEGERRQGKRKEVVSLTGGSRGQGRASGPSAWPIWTQTWFKVGPE